MKKMNSLIILIILSFNFLFPIISIATDEIRKEELIMYISNEEELWNFARKVNEGENLSGYTIKLTKDIKLNCSESKQWIPIGKDYNTQFKGTFDGQNFTISGLYISSIEDDFAGLFGYASDINNLIVKDSSIIQDTDVSKYIGMIAGKANLKNCKTVNCTIRLSNILHPEGNASSWSIGGIVGEIISSIYRCNNETNIIVKDVKSDLVFTSIGGLVGDASHGLVKKCSNKGNISIDTYACSTGGIVGDGYMELENCYNSGDIIALGDARYNATGTGGIIGSNHGTINRCYNLGNISGDVTIGGISGVNFSKTDSVTNCYNMGTIKAVNSPDGGVCVGGITGRNGGTPVGDDGALIENCYNIGIVSKENTNSIVGNLIGINEENGILNNCYYLANTNNSSIAKNESTKEVSAIAKNSDDMKNSTFVNMLNNNIDVFKIDECNLNKGYPILLWTMNMEIEKKPDKLFYRQNIEDLDLNGGKVKLKYNYSEYDTTIDMNSDMISVSGFSNANEGTIKVNVLYTDEYGDKFEKEFDVEIVESIPPELSVAYSTTKMTNKDVTATITANEEVQEVNGWTLSNNKKSMTKVYSSNTDIPEEVIVKDLVGNEAKISVSVTNIDKVEPIGKVTYSTTEPTNKDVTATITANEKIQQVEGWKISSDSKKLSKTFNVNNEETVTIKDLAGNETPIKIAINNINKTEIEAIVDYSTTLLTNQDVDVTVSLNKKVENVPGWTISEDGKVLSKTFEQNAEEKLTIYDEYGNSKNVIVSVNNIDKVKPEIEIEYSIKELTNQDVIVTVSANESIQEVEEWTLHENGKTLTKTYNLNENEEVIVKDLVGNFVELNIEVNNIDKIPPKLNVKYSTIEETTENVTITITANEEVQPIKEWTLSEDKKSLTKTYSSNKTEKIMVYDLAGNNAIQKIEIKNILNNKIAPQILPKAGKKDLIYIIIILTVIILILLGARLKNYKDIK